MKKKHSKFPGSHVTRVIGSTQETQPSRSKEIEQRNVHHIHANDPWKDAPLTRFEALKIMTTKVDKAVRGASWRSRASSMPRVFHGTGNLTCVEAIREFSKWQEEGNFLGQLELLKAIS